MSGKRVKERLNGPALVEWLDVHRRNPFPTETESGTCRDFLDHSDRRKLRRWRGGFDPDIYSADVVLTRLNVHLSELPDEMFVGSVGDLHFLAASEGVAS